MDSRNLAIGAMSTIAAILLVGLIVIHSRPGIAVASGMSERAGQYQLVVGTDPSGDEEYLYVLNNTLQRMIAYRFNPNNNQIELLTGVDLATLSSPPPPAQGRRRRP